MRFDFIHTHTQSPLSLSTVAHQQSRDTNSNNNNNNERRAILSKTRTQKKAKDDMCVRVPFFIYRERERLLIKSDTKSLLPPPFFSSLCNELTLGFQSLKGGCFQR